MQFKLKNRLSKGSNVNFPTIFTTRYPSGFNGKENDNEIKGVGNQQDYGMRTYDPRLGKFLSVDPLTKDYPWYTPYQFAGNKPIWAVDLDGKEEFTQIDYYNSCGDLYATKLKVQSSKGMKDDNGKGDKQLVHHLQIKFKDDETYDIIKGEDTFGSTIGKNAFEDQTQRRNILNRDLKGDPIKYPMKTPKQFDSDGDHLADDNITQRATLIMKLPVRQTVAKKTDVYYNDEDKILKTEPTRDDTFIFDSKNNSSKYSPEIPNVRNPLPEN